MTRVEEVEKTVSDLPDREYHQFRSWFLERDQERWDKEIQADSDSGKLGFLVKEAREEKKRGSLTDL